MFSPYPSELKNRLLSTDSQGQAGIFRRMIEKNIQVIDVILTGKDSEDRALREKLENRFQNRQTLIQNIEESSSVIPWYTIPANIQNAQQKGMTKPLYYKDESKLLHCFSSDEEFAKFSLAYEIYLEIFWLYYGLWIIIGFQAFIGEISSYFFCEYKGVNWILSHSFNCDKVSNGLLYVKAVKLVLQIVGIMIVKILFNKWKRYLLNKWKPELKYYSYSEKKFCILVQNLPKKTNFQDIKDFFENSLKLQIPVKVRGAILVREGDKINQSIKKRKEFQRRKMQRRSYEDSLSPDKSMEEWSDEETLQKVRRNTAEFHSEINKILKEPSHEEHLEDFTGCAIVCFETIEMRDEVKRYYKLSKKRCCCRKVYFPRFGKSKVKIHNLSDPADVIWPNVNTSKTVKKVKQGFLFLVLGFLLVIFSGLSASLLDWVTISGGNSSLQVLLFSLQFLFGILVRVVGKIASFLIPYKSQNELEKFRFGYLLACDLIVFNFSTWGYAYYYEDNKMEYYQVPLKILAIMMLTNSVFYIYTYLRDWISKYSKRKQIKADGTNFLTQREAEICYRRMKLNFLRRTASLFLPLTVAMTLYMVYPIAILVCFLVQFLFIRVDKQLIARYYTLPSESDAELALECYRVFNRLVIFQICAYALFETIVDLKFWKQTFEKVLLPQIFAPTQIVLMLLSIGMLGYWFFSFLVYMGKMKKPAKPEEQHLHLQNDYEKASQYFETTYLMTYVYSNEKKFF